MKKATGSAYAPTTTFLAVLATVISAACLNVLFASQADAGTLASPHDLKAWATSLRGIALSWEYEGAAVEGFQIERQIGSQPYIVVARPRATDRSYSESPPASSYAVAYRMRAYSGAEVSSYSNTAVVTYAQRRRAGRGQLPAPPSGLVAKGVSPSEIVLIWSLRSICQNAIKVQRSASPSGTFETAAALAPDATSYRDGGLAMETSYFYRVAAEGSDGYTAYSPAIGASTLGVPPNGATGLLAVIERQGEVILSWHDNANNETGFTIERSAYSSRGFTEIASTGPNAISFVDSSADTSRTLYYRISAHNNYGNSQYVQATANWRPVANAGPDKTGTTSQAITFDGSGSSDHDGQITSYQWSFGDGTTASGATASHQYSSTGTYVATLTATDNGGLTSSDTAAVAVTSGSSVELTITLVKHNRVEMSWNLPADAFFSRVQRAGSPTGSFTTIKTVMPPSCTYADTSVQPQTTYYYRIEVYKTAGGVYTSSVKRVDTPAPTNEPPTANAGLDQRGTTQGGVTFDGSGSTDPEGKTLTYQWQFGDGTTATGKTVTKLYSTPGRYTVTLTVTDDGGLSASDTASVVIDPTLNLVGWLSDIGANVKDVAVSGSYAYVASEPFGLVVVDVSNPAAPKVLGSQHPIGPASSVAVSGNTAVVTGTPRGTDFIDISDRERPQVVASIPGSSGDVEITGNYALFTNGGAVKVVNISNPWNPVVLSQISVPGSPTGIAAVGNTVYITDCSSGALFVADISTPNAPRIVGQVSLSGMPLSVDAANGLAFVCNRDTLQVVNVVNPTSPVLVGSVNVSSAADAAFFGERYVAVAAYGYGTRIVDVSNPSAPTLAGSTGSSEYNDAVRIRVSGSYAYVAHRVWGLKVVDVSDTARLVGISSLQHTENAFRITASGNTAVVTGTPRGTDFIDISDRERPQVVASISGTSGDVEITGNYALFASGGAVKIVSISNPWNPVILSQIPVPGSPAGIAAVGNTVYITDCSSAALLVGDISVPNAPRIVGQVSLGGMPLSVDAANGLAFVCNRDTLQVVNVINPTSPVLVGSVNVGSAADAAFFGERYVAVAAYGYGTRIVDVSNPGAPTLAGSTGSSEYNDAVRIRVSGSYAYVAHRVWGLKVVDVTNPSQPVAVQTLGTPGTCYAVGALPSAVVAADSSSTLTVFKIE